MNLKTLLEEGTKELEEVFDETEAKASAWFLLSGCFRVGTKEYLMRSSEELEKEDVLRYQAMIRRRLEHEPTAYILGEWEFMGLPVKVSPSVLIPRPDTETLVEAAISYVRSHYARGSKIRILDICTGSGCIAISLGSFLSGDYNLVIEAGDISEEALNIARENAEMNGVNVMFSSSDLAEAFQNDPYDLIVCNPPYVPLKTVMGLEPDVKDYEPFLALSGGEDGLVIYRKLIPQLSGCLKEGGAVFFEIGEEQADAVRKLLKESGRFENIQLTRDLAGNDRVVSANRK